MEPLLKTINCKTYPGEGLEGELEGLQGIIRAGTPEWLKVKGVNWTSDIDDVIKQACRQGQTLVAIAFQKKLLGLIMINDQLRPGIDITDNEALATEAGKFANTIFHPVSTCRMGNYENAVVNDRLIAHDLKNLRIVDASVMPHITSGNTNAPTIMIAEKAADMILEDSKS